MTNKIAFIICYFGKFPWYFKFFCASLAHNRNIDFFLITDNVPPEDIPINLHIVPESLSNIRKLANLKFGFEVSLNHPYKLCDFKPAYGFLFSEMINGYDFWGHGDLDVLYGNINHLITDDILNSFDVISTRPESISGFFALFRNNKMGKNLFRHSADFQRVFQSDTNYCFDECNGKFNDLWAGKSIFEIDSEIESMTYVIKKLHLEQKLRACFGLMVLEGSPGKIEWCKGELLYEGHTRFLLYHFIEFKSLHFIYLPDWEKIPDRFFIYQYYILRHSPTSVYRYLIRVPLFLAKKFAEFMLYAKHYLLWVNKYLRANRKLNKEHWPFKDLILGVYCCGDLEVRLSESREGYVIANWGEKASSPLLHLTANKFVLNRFSINSDINIDIEFQFDEIRRDYSLHLISAGTYRTIFLKK